MIINDNLAFQQLEAWRLQSRVEVRRALLSAAESVAEEARRILMQKPSGIEDAQKVRVAETGAGDAVQIIAPHADALPDEFGGLSSPAAGFLSEALAFSRQGFLAAMTQALQSALYPRAR